jgi:hypothetical protein
VAQNFEQHHPVLVGFKPSKLDLKHARNSNEHAIGDYYDKQEELNKKHGGILPEHKWNMDKKGIQMGGGRKNNGRKYYYLRKRYGKNTPSKCYHINSDNLELVTVVEFVDRLGSLKSNIVYCSQSCLVSVDSSFPQWQTGRRIKPSLRECDVDMTN